MNLFLFIFQKIDFDILFFLFANSNFLTKMIFEYLTNFDLFCLYYFKWFNSFFTFKLQGLKVIYELIFSDL
jgi:hypothetical protein